MGHSDSDTHRTAVDRLVLLLATGLGTGRSPWAPGTAGSVLGLGWAWTLSMISPPFLSGPGMGLPGLRLLITLAAAAVAVPICTRACRLLGGKDPGQVVLDEIVAVPLVFGCGLLPTDLPSLISGFVIFRFFDILKPPPIRRFERLPEGAGVVADDMIAGLYAGLVLWAGHEAYQRLIVAGDLLPSTPFG